MWEPQPNTRCHANHSFTVRHRTSHSQLGFSLIELLITLAIILILTTMYWGGASGDSEKQKHACAQNLQKIHLALEIYSHDFGGKYPNVAGAQTSEEALDILVPRYSSDTSIFICPASKDSSLPSGESFRKRTISFAYYMGRKSGGTTAEVLMSDRQKDTLSKNAGDYAFSESSTPPRGNHGKRGGNFLFSDGHVESSPVQVPFSLVLTQGVVLLNPKP